MKNRFFRVAKCSSDEPGSIFSELAISTFHIDGIDGFTAYCLYKYLRNSFGCSINNGISDLQQTSFFIPLFLHLDLFQIRERQPFEMRAAASSSVGRQVIKTIMTKQSLFIKPVIRSKQGRFAITVRLDLADKFGRLSQGPAHLSSLFFRMNDQNSSICTCSNAISRCI